jgi:MFS family permease
VSGPGAPDSLPEHVTRGALASLAGTFLTQGAAAFGFIAFSLLAPGLAEETGQDERDFGLAFSFIFLGSALASPLCGRLMRRFGSVGTMVLTLTGMAAVALIALFGTWVTVMLAAFLYGLFYGPYGPANITVVTRKTPKRRVGLFLAIRQSGVSLAGAGGGFILPPIMLAVGWQLGIWSMVGVLAAAVVMTLLFAPLFRVAPEQPTMKTELHRTFPRRLAASFVLPPNLRLLGGIAVLLAVMHTTLFTFVYIYLLEDVGLSPVLAGQFFAIIQLVAIVGRPVMGWLSDRWGRPELVLLGIAIAASSSIVLAMLIGSDTPVWMIYPVALLAGLSGNTWSPIFAMIVGRRAPEGELAEVTGRAYSLAALGWTASPLIMWSLIELSGGYMVPFGTVVGLGVVATFAILRDMRGLEPRQERMQGED